MKLLFDQNLSSRLVKLLADIFPDSAHVRLLGMMDSSDHDIWNYAISGGYVLVSKDSDFFDLASVAERGPKIIWIQLGNCSTPQVESLLRMRLAAILTFGESVETTALVSP